MKKKSFSEKNLIFRCFSLKKVFEMNFFYSIKLFVFFSLIVFYIFQVAEMTKDTYKTQVYNKEVSNIYEESRRAEYGFLKSSSVSRADELIEIDDFVRAENIYYIDLSDFEIASR